MISQGKCRHCGETRKFLHEDGAIRPIGGVACMVSASGLCEPIPREQRMSFRMGTDANRRAGMFGRRAKR